MSLKVVNNQNGIALVLALLMLVVMSLIGIMTLNTTNTELGIASNYKQSQSTISEASSIVAYAQTNGSIYSAIGIDSINLTDGNPATQTVYEKEIAGLGGGLRMREGIEVGDPPVWEAHPEWNRVEYLSMGPLPRGAGTQVNAEDGGFVGRYYLISTAVEEARGGGAVTRVESQLVRVVPK